MTKSVARYATISGLLVVVAGGAIPAAASAVEPEERVHTSCDALREMPGDFEFGVAVPQFDPAQGTLTSVVLHTEFKGLEVSAIENITDTPWPAGFTYGPVENELRISSYFGHLLDLQNSQTFVADEHPEITAFDGVDDGAGSSAWRFNMKGDSPATAETPVDPARLAEFVGDGETPIISTTASHLYGQTNITNPTTDVEVVSSHSLLADQDLTSIITVCAEYTYQESAPVDPNPVDPNPVDPNPVDPNPVDPKPVDPKSVDPAAATPNPVDPAASAPGDSKPTTSSSRGTDRSGTLAETGGASVAHLVAVGALLVSAAGGIAAIARLRRRAESSDAG